jgi:hypothetical protein
VVEDTRGGLGSSRTVAPRSELIWASNCMISLQTSEKKGVT